MLSSSSDSSCQQLSYKQLSAFHPKAQAARDWQFTKQRIGRCIISVNILIKLYYLAISSTCYDINCINFILLKLCIINPCIWIGYTQHNLIPINHKLFHLVAKNTLNNFTIIRCGNLLNCFSYILVLSGKEEKSIRICTATCVVT